MSSREFYLDLLKRTVINAIYQDVPWTAEADPEFDTEDRELGMDLPTRAHTMVGRRRLDNVQECLEKVIDDGVPGDFVETGVWRGGVCVFARGVLAARGVTDRRIWLADSFQGFPVAMSESHPLDQHMSLHRANAAFGIPLAEVQDTFRRYGLLDEQVGFLPGWFRDTLPAAPIDQISVLRLDGDLYESTMDALTHLYPKLSPGGYVIIDDYSLAPCRKAVHEFRAAEGIDDEIIPVDLTAVYWRRGGSASDRHRDHMAAGRDSTAPLYLDLLKRVLTNLVYQDPPVHRTVGPTLHMRVADPNFDEATRSLGEDFPSLAHTMVGLRRLENLHRCMAQVVDDGVPGDFVETGVWRGGTVVFMQAFLDACQIDDRTVWAADTFAGIPEPVAPLSPADHDEDWQAINDILTVDIDQVRDTIRRYGRDDDRVRFLVGSFQETLAHAPIDRLAILHLDSGTYEGTHDALSQLYPRLAPGGYLIISDYVSHGARRAVHEYRRANKINTPFQTIDHLGVYWRRGTETSATSADAQRRPPAPSGASGRMAVTRPAVTDWLSSKRMADVDGDDVTRIRAPSRGYRS